MQNIRSGNTQQNSPDDPFSIADFFKHGIAESRCNHYAQTCQKMARRVATNQKLSMTPHNKVERFCQECC